MALVNNLIHPKKFIQNSMWFKKDTIDIDTTANNLFVISHLGQLSQVEALIEYENLTDNFLVIVYTSTNKAMPELIKEKYNRQLFKGSYLLLLPDSPNDMRKKKLLFMRRNYIQVFKAIQPESLYVLSFEGHYNLLTSYAKQNRCKICLIEEGTATYKREILPEASKGLGEKFKKIGINSAYFFLKSFLFVKQIKNINSDIKRYKDFDKLYVSFPSLIKDKFNAKETENFFLHAGEIKNREKIESFIETYNMTENDFIYVNQRYSIENQEFAKAIIIILEEVVKDFKSKIFIKMHPKDTPSLKNEFVKQIQIRNIQKEIIFIEESDFLIEPTVAVLKPRAVLGLTSTALVYVPLVSPKTNVYSIAFKFLNRISNKSYNKNGVKTIKEHLDILRDFSHVNILKKSESLFSAESKKQKNNFVQKDALEIKETLKIVEFSLSQKQYKKVYFYLGQLYPDGIESMPLNIQELYTQARDIEKNLLLERDNEFIENIKAQEGFSNYKLIEERISSLEDEYILFKMPIEVLEIYINSLHIQYEKAKLYLLMQKISLKILLDNDLDSIKKNQLVVIVIRELLRFGHLTDARKIYNQVISSENQFNKKVLKKLNILLLQSEQKNEEIVSLVESSSEILDDQELKIIYLNSLKNLKQVKKIEEFIHINSDKLQLLGKIYLNVLNRKLIDAVYEIEKVLPLFSAEEQIEFGIQALLIDLCLKNVSLKKAKEHILTYENHLKGDVTNINHLVKLNSLINKWDKVELVLEQMYTENLLDMSIELMELYLMALLNLEKKYKFLQVLELLLNYDLYTIKILSQYIDILIEIGDIQKAREIVLKYVDSKYQDFFKKKLYL
jgi:hypothetical protein